MIIRLYALKLMVRYAYFTTNELCTCSWFASQLPWPQVVFLWVRLLAPCCFSLGAHLGYSWNHCSKKPAVIMCPCIYIKRNIVYPLNCVPAKALKAASVHRSITTAFLPDNSSVTVTLLTWQCLRWDANSLHILKTGRSNLHGQKYSWEEAVHRKWRYFKSTVNK